ncbi:hypothetical protein [Collimonas fungivorans]|uniref:hypothetical protein n=1 Tax=Collimonas fungivorans TaxID=158899 RepID=UPI000A9338B3|nr:hypothetical protein [Collimonas fungivorans]
MDETMKDEDKLKIYMAMAEVSRKWVTVMDTKAGFLSALNIAVLSFMWTGAKLLDAGGLAKGLGLISSALAIFSLFAALWTVFPRGSLQAVFGKHSRYTNDFKAISFYGYVSKTYPKGKEAHFFCDVLAMDAKALCREVLEQHYTICHSAVIKEKWVGRASMCLLLAMLLTGASLVAKCCAEF